MPAIGTFRRESNGYSGTIRTLTLNARVRIVAAEQRTSEGAPDFRLFVGAVEIGAAWRRTAKDTETAYLSVRIDDPALPAPLQAALMEATDDGLCRLLWRRET
jgi:uncharacterized protein (DUF736 family)